MKSLLAFIVGAALASALFVLVVLPKVSEDKYEFGYYQGEISTKSEFARRVREKLGSDYSRDEGGEFFMDAKTVGLFVVQRNGVRTLRVSDDRR